jgi:amino acid permease
MSNKGKARRERYQERQAEQGTKVFNWLLAIIGLGAVAMLIWYSVLAS